MPAKSLTVNLGFPGGVAEWSIASVLKTEEAQVSVGSNPTPSVSRRSRVETFRWDEERSSSAKHRSPPATNPTPSVSRRSRVETFRWDEERSSSAKHRSPPATNPTPSVSRLNHRAGTARSTLIDVWCLILWVSDRRRRRFRYSLGSLFLVARGWGNHALGPISYLFRYEP